VVLKAEERLPVVVVVVVVWCLQACHEQSTAAAGLAAAGSSKCGQNCHVGQRMEDQRNEAGNE
jgi:hypothetical protein